jgi:hypothetical protein
MLLQSWIGLLALGSSTRSRHRTVCSFAKLLRPLQQPRLLDRVRAVIRARHYSRRTEKAYAAWIRRFILFHGKRHPTEMGAAEVTQLPSALVVDKDVAASTQNQALSAILFLYRDVLEQDLPWLDDVLPDRPTIEHRREPTWPYPTHRA